MRSGSRYTLQSCAAGAATGGTFDARYIKLSLSSGSSTATTEHVSVDPREHAPCGSRGPAGISDPEGVVLSALRGELYLFGSNGDSPSTDAYVQRVGADAWERVSLAPSSAIGDVFAATYVGSEQRIYFVENGNHGLRLGRWDTKSANVDWLLTFLEEWRLDKFWLSESLDGRLAFVATAGFEDESVVALLQSRNGDNLEVDQVASIAGRVFGPPLADFDGVSLDIASGGTFDDLRQRRIPYDEFCHGELCLHQN